MSSTEGMPESPPAAPGISPLTWGVPLAVTLLSFAGVILAVALRSGGASDLPPEAVEVTPTPRRAAAATAVVAPQATSQQASGGTVRVMKTGGTAEQLASGGYRVWFTWTLEGARDGDPALIRVYAGSQQLGEQRGALTAGVFDPATGVLTLSATGACSTAGWSAELVSVRDQPPGGEAVARVPAPACR